jgi:hypothetical protein
VQPGCGLSGYAFLVPTTVLCVSQSQVDDLRHNQIEPALHNDWKEIDKMVMTERRSRPEHPARPSARPAG